GPQTGPKGVLNDYRFHNAHQRVLKEEQEKARLNRINRAGLSSGWLQRQLEAEKREKEDKKDHYLRLQTLPRFGNLREIEAGDYVQAIDGAASDVKVLIHLYQPQIEACRQTNYFLSHLARKYPTIKFLKIVSTKADAKFDNVALPALLVYRGGSLIITILRIIDEVPGWASKGVCELEDFEELLAKKGVIDEAEIEAGFSGLTLEDPEDD
ncbi:thioredoxin-like protein, partial [Cladochytrium replicatum]